MADPKTNPLFNYDEQEVIKQSLNAYEASLHRLKATKTLSSIIAIYDMELAKIPPIRAKL